MKINNDIVMAKLALWGILFTLTCFLELRFVGIENFTNKNYWFLMFLFFIPNLYGTINLFYTLIKRHGQKI